LEEKKERINKYLSRAGYCSRRQADALLEEGRVTVDGHKAQMGEKVSTGQAVCVDGIPVTPVEEKVLLVFNKPKGIVCTTGHYEGNVIDYINYPVRIYPIGRLDKDSTGLLLLTNQGDLVNAILKASNYHEKEYVVTVDKDLTRDFLDHMREGVPILDTVTRKCRVWATGRRTFRIILTQGLNRQIRRMCEALGYRVRELERIRVMNITLDGLETGKYRDATPAEWEGLEKLLRQNGD
jgi:23S rRNA pseudouridine2604 synthase